MAFEAHLTYAEYTDLGFSDLNDASGFDKIEHQAQRAIDSIVDYFYSDHDIKKDPNPKRVDAYKTAICEQIDFINQTGVTASYNDGNDFNSISVGRLSLQPSNHAVENGTIHGVCKEAYRILAHYGLLYRGRGSDWFVTSYS